MLTLRQWLIGPARSWAVSQFHAFIAIVLFVLGDGIVKGTIKDFSGVFAIVTHQPFWFGVFVAMVLGLGPYARAVQGANRVRNEGP